MLRAKFKAADGSKLDSIDFNLRDYVGAEDKFLAFCKQMYDLLKDDPGRARLDLTLDLRTKTEGLAWANARTDELNELRSRQLDVTIPGQDEPVRTMLDVARLRVPTLRGYSGIGCPNSHWRIDGAESDRTGCPHGDDGRALSCEECWGRTAAATARAHSNPQLEGFVTTDGCSVPESVD